MSIADGGHGPDDVLVGNGTSTQDVPPIAPSLFQHNLFCRGGSTVLSGGTKSNASVSQPSNANVNGLAMPPKAAATPVRYPSNQDNESSDEGTYSDEDDPVVDPMLQLLSIDALPTEDSKAAIVVVERSSLFDPWNVSFGIVKGRAENSALYVQVNEDGPTGLENGDMVSSINTVELGMAGAANLQEILSTLREATTLEIGIMRRSKEGGVGDTPAVDVETTKQATS